MGISPIRYQRDRSCVQSIRGRIGIFWYFCVTNIGLASLVPGYTVRHSLGLVQGKSDPVDAARLREYRERFADKLSFREYQSEQMSELRQLYSIRSQLVKARKELPDRGTCTGSAANAKYIGQLNQS